MATKSSSSSTKSISSSSSGNTQIGSNMYGPGGALLGPASGTSSNTSNTSSNSSNNQPQQQTQASTPVWNLSKWTSDASGNFVQKPTLTVNGQVQNYSTPDEFISGLNSIKSQGSDGPLDQFISEFQAVSKKPSIPGTIDSSIINGNATVPTVPNVSNYNPASTTLAATVGATPSVGSNATNLNEYYQAQGQTLPSLSQRQSIAKQAGISNYSGSTQQNATLLQYLKNQGGQQQSQAGNTTNQTQNTGSTAMSNTGTQDTSSTQTNGYAGNKIQDLLSQVQGSGNPYLTQLQELTNKASKEDADTATLQQQYQVAQKAREIADIDTQQTANKLAYDMQVAKIRENASGTFGGAMQQDLNKAEMEYLNKSSALAINKALKTNDLSMANSLIEQTLAATYEPIKAQISYLKDFSTLYKDDLTESQKLVLNSMIKQQEKALETPSISEQYGTGTIGEYNFAKANGYSGSFIQYQNEDANRKKSIARAGVGDNGLGGFTNAQINASLNSNTGAFDGEPIVKNFNVVKSGYNFAKNISSTSENSSDHQALIYAFAKAMDPDSVVREGEYATVQKYSQSWVQRYGKSFMQAVEGTGFLTQTAMDNMKKTIAAKYSVAETQYKDLKKEYDRKEANIRSGKGNTLQDYSSTSTASPAPAKTTPVSVNGGYDEYNKIINQKKK